MLVELITNSKHFDAKIAIFKVIPDDFEQIKSELTAICDKSSADVILTSGGTGFGVRDVTPEATKTVIEKEAHGLSLAILNRSLQITPMAALSRLLYFFICF